MSSDSLCSPADSRLSGVDLAEIERRRLSVREKMILVILYIKYTRGQITGVFVSVRQVITFCYTCMYINDVILDLSFSYLLSQW